MPESVKTHDHSRCLAADPDDIGTPQRHAVHDFLIARGWQLDPWTPTDPETGYPTDNETGWHYPASYGGVAMNTVDDVSPKALACDFWIDTEDGGWPDESSVWVRGFRVSGAGNWRSCPEHEIGVHEFDVPEDCMDIGLDRLAELLDSLEPHARSLDPRELIECTFFGPCGEGAS